MTRGSQLLATETRQLFIGSAVRTPGGQGSQLSSALQRQRRGRSAHKAQRSGAPGTGSSERAAGVCAKCSLGEGGTLPHRGPAFPTPRPWTCALGDGETAAFCGATNTNESVSRGRVPTQRPSRAGTGIPSVGAAPGARVGASRGPCAAGLHPTLGRRWAEVPSFSVAAARALLSGRVRAVSGPRTDGSCGPHVPVLTVRALGRRTRTRTRVVSLAGFVVTLSSCPLETSSFVQTRLACCAAGLSEPCSSWVPCAHRGALPL